MLQFSSETNELLQKQFIIVIACHNIIRHAAGMWELHEYDK